jgi:hypothetical protein
MTRFALALLALVALTGTARLDAQTRRTFTGVITESECADARHSLMGMGDTDAECVKACVDAHGATYVLYDGKTTYSLTDQKTPAAFAGQKVTVTGTLDAKGRTIVVDSIAAAK